MHSTARKEEERDPKERLFAIWFRGIIESDRSSKRCGYADVHPLHKASLHAEIREAIKTSAPSRVIFPVLMGVTEGGALAMSKMAVRFLAIGLPLRFVNLLLSQYYQTIGRTRLAIFISVMEVFAASVFVAAVLKGPMGADGIWLSFLIGECLTLIITMVVIWVIGKHGSLMDRIIMLPDDFGGSDEDKLSVSIGNSMDEVIGLNISVMTLKR